MKKIGIVTMYYKSINYGGVLQAYALARVLNDMGAEAYQIKYDFRRNRVLSVRNRVIEPFRQLYTSVKLKERYLSFELFREQIPHTDTVYNDTTIADLNDCFDVFVTGSDQVWNLDAFRAPFFLTFSNKKKISYSAGMGQSNSKFNPEKMRELLQGYSAISVREEESLELMKDCTSLDIKVVADPTLLLDRSEWDLLATKIIPDNYIFCYFLGSDAKMRETANAFAKKKNLPIYTIPHIARFMKEDLRFGDRKLFDASPQDFISLIKCAKYIFTDSFHCCVFSSIYHKEYFVFERTGKKGMSARIRSITNLFNMESRFCYEGRNNIRYIESLGGELYDDSEYEELKSKSLTFLRENCIFTE